MKPRPTNCHLHAMRLAREAADQGDIARASDLFELAKDLIAEKQAERKWARGKSKGVRQ